MVAYYCEIEATIEDEAPEIIAPGAICEIPEVEIEVVEFAEERPTVYAGEYQCTAYTATGNACADGAQPRAGYTAASNNPAFWHHWLYIEGIGDVYIHDTGGMPSNVIDIYMETRAACIQFGRQTRGVWVYQ